VPLDPASIDLPSLASLAGASATEHLLGRLRAAGHARVRSSHGYIIQHLIAGTPTVGELAGQLAVTQQAASKFVLELESLGYAERRPDPVDSRIRRVALTAQGQSLVEQARAARAKLEAEVSAAVGAHAVRAARRALVAMLEVTGGTDAVARRRVKPPST